MKNIQNFNNFNLIKEEASPRLPKSEDWLKKGKDGKKKLFIYMMIWMVSSTTIEVKYLLK
jgi:hypothetical protein